MRANQLNPIFFIGMPRSGTTIIFEAFARHPELAWPSNYSARFPRRPFVESLRSLLDNEHWTLAGHKGQYGAHRFGNRYLPHPAEAYRFWNLHSGTDLGRQYLSDQEPDEAHVMQLRKAVSAVVRWQRRGRFCAKFTGPPRMSYLAKAFPEATFVQIVRDGRAVVHSLLRTKFWTGKGGLEKLFWAGPFPEELIDEWKRADRDPGVLAAIQWRHIVQCARREAHGLDASRYIELKYEDFVAAPRDALRRVLEFSGLDYCSEIDRYLEGSPKLVDMNVKYRRDFSTEYVGLLTQVMRPALKAYGYTTED